MKTILVDAVNTLVILGKGIFEEMYALLEAYPNRKIILTNANDAQMVEFGLTELPYEVFTLKHDPEKTDSSYFLSFLEAYNLKSEDVIYFEHNLDATLSAQSVGITTYHYDKDLKDLSALKAFLDENL